MQFYGVLTKIDPEGKPYSIGFPYNPEATKARRLDVPKSEAFSWVGDGKSATLFGKDRFPAGSAQAITITEGEPDALSAFQMLGGRYPVVSVRSSGSAESDCRNEREYLNSFSKIYLCLDADKAGQEATNKVARLFDFNKVYDVRLPKELKDANGFLQTKDRTEEFKRIWWNSKRFLPEGIVSNLSEFKEILRGSKSAEGVPFPFPTLQRMTYGIRTGETYLFTALEGTGKTEIIRAIEYSLLQGTDANIGIIHLEEDKARALKGLAGYYLKAPVHLPGSPFTEEEVEKALEETIRRDERLHIYSHFGSDDPDVILDTIRFLVTACNCKYVFLDHITMVVSGLKEDDERRTLDYISTRLATMVEELDFCLIFVSHINDDGKTRGSRNISKIAGTWVQLDRDLQAKTDEKRNSTFLTLNKNRFGSQTGPAGVLRFDPETFIISEIDSRDFDLPPIPSGSPVTT